MIDPVYQLIISPYGNGVLGAEVLSRVYTDPDLPPLPPGLALGFALVTAEACSTFDRNVLQRSLETDKADQQFIFLFWNVWAQSLSTIESVNGMLSFLENSARQGLITPSRLVIEINENVDLLSAPFMRFFTRAKQMGFKLAADDLGIGHGDKTKADLYGWDFVKIDWRPLVRNWKTQTEAIDVSRQAKTIGAKVIVEGIESAADLTFATTVLEGDYVQGFFFGQPKVISKVIDMNFKDFSA